MSCRSLAVLLAICGLMPPALRAEDEPARLILHHQGRLIGENDAPEQGSREMLIRLWESEHAELPLWSETYEVQLDANGYYSIALGQTRGQKKPLGVQELRGERWLSVTIGANEFRPRLRVGGTGTAAWSQSADDALNAQTLQGLGADLFARVDHEHSAEEILELREWLSGEIGEKGHDNPSHHDRYTDTEAVAAMGARDDTNPLHHERYSDAEALAAMGAEGDSNPFNHSRYTNAEALAAMGAEGDSNPFNHSRYTDAEAVAALGARDQADPLNHERYSDAEALAALGVKGNDNALHHDRYTNAEAVAAMGTKGHSNALNHDRYTSSEAVAAMGVRDNDNALNHDRYTNAEAVAAMGTKGSSNALHHDRYTNAEAVAAMGAKGSSNALHHDRYTNAEAVAAMGTKGSSNALNHDRYTDAEALAALQGKHVVAAQFSSPWMFQRTYYVNKDSAAPILDYEGNPIPANYHAQISCIIVSTNTQALSSYLVKRFLDGTLALHQLALLSASNTPVLFNNDGILSLKLYNHANNYEVRCTTIRL